MSYGMTIADLVQQVYYAIYKVRLDVAYSDDLPEAFHADTDKFKEVIFETNFTLQELVKEQDWHWLREKYIFGMSEVSCHGHIMEFDLPDRVYKVGTGFNDAIRLRNPKNPMDFIEVPFTQARSGNSHVTAMFDSQANLNVPDNRLMAFMVGNTVTFTRPFFPHECGRIIETDIIRRLEPLHICDGSCVQPCPRAYEEVVLTEIPDPHYVVLKVAAKRAEGDPSATDRVQFLTDDATKMLSAMRENDSSKTTPDTYRTAQLGYVSVL